ncbi:General stress protein 69 [Gemmata obscuriglobus]|uniref:Aldo/keto reductase n=1 Tax=Gemmata obscuriglobus TaxID=114 RepID=A0A2Z3HEQ9_9BACT|nr:aldo/keto reductase [Gemmata obscuriglobus]AWM41435.1 aldo/keto reductase [Gemmata obscuriglobus]QEG32659.1 General stress protein 69 [Gemmata obscuriglobus]VTS12015.1 aldo keto reductase : Oxidoreductase, aldo/keto reductase family OS=Acidobacterium capsulatum (strain ATCC 51196 / DSM 11244 / JCM 7670) GN=ACP_2817 PE=4 SV=1: Aldo_ket_red [Gemmata obscuriglobus UQM 2246]
MQLRQLGHSDLSITPIGFGAWAIGGGGWAFAWGAQDDAESVATIREALDLGVNWIDTAAVYGLGHSEEVVAKALAGVPKRPYVFTKCARVWDESRQIGKRLTADSIRAECEASLKRLKVDVIDLYQIHWPEPPEDIDEGWQTLVKLKEEGKIRWAGVSNFSAEQMAQVSKFGPITSLQPPYSMIRPEVEESILPYCQAHNIGVIAYSPMASGLLTGAMTRERVVAMPADDWRKEKNRHYQEPLLTRNLNLVDLLKTIGARHGRAPGAVAIAWVLRHPAVTAAIVGARRPGQLKELLGAADWRLTPAEIGEIDVFLKANPA